MTTPDEDLLSFLSEHKPLDGGDMLNPGDLVCGWRVVVFLGRGGGGEVYRVENVVDGKVAALKIYSPHAKHSAVQDCSSRERFLRESKFLSLNRYSFFPRQFAKGEYEDHPFFVMELLEPVSLPEGDKAVAEFLTGVCSAVNALHRCGFVHRDIKPQNIMRRENGELVLIDLGLIKHSRAAVERDGTSVTMVGGQVVGAGTPQYAAPEQFSGGEISPASDIHALGMLANECFGGNPPRSWERIIGRCTSSIPSRRYASVGSLQKAIRHRHRPGWQFWSILGVLAVAVLALVLTMLKDAPTVDIAAREAAAKDYWSEGMAFLKGTDGRPKDVERARKLLVKAGDMFSLPTAAWRMQLLGSMFLNRKSSFKRDGLEAAKWFRKGVRFGNPWCMGSLSELYRDGFGVERDLELALKYAKMASEHGMNYYLAEYYARGIGVKRDLALALKLREKDANWLNESMKSQSWYDGYVDLHVGAMYERGEGTPVDVDKAIFCYERAVKRGNVRARERLNALKSAKGGR